METIVGTTSSIVERSWIQTFTGKAFNIFDPTEESVCIEDIAHALAMKCRFNGQCLRFYSVAEHSVLMSRAHKIAKHSEAAREITRCDRRGCLMHDITEAYLPDVARPIKNHLMIWTPWGTESFRDFEARLLAQLIDRLNLSKRVFCQNETVKCMDSRMLATEAASRQLMTRPEQRWSALPEPLDVELYYWSPEIAEHEFLHEFYTLF